MPTKVTAKLTSQKIILLKLEAIHKCVSKNSRDIEALKEQVAMGKGGIRAIFIVGSLIAVILGFLKLIKIWG